MSPRGIVRRDLVVLVADRNMEHALRGILERDRSLGTRPIDFEVIPYVGKADPGCYRQSHNFLRPYQREFEHALVIFDRDGAGQEARTAGEVEDEVAGRLRGSGWKGRADVVVIVPELETWVWGPSPQVAPTLGWRGRPIPLREWLEKEGLWAYDQVKPPDPKAALENALKELKRPRSSSIYAELAGNVGLQRCSDRSFRRLVEILRSWFPPSEPTM